MIPRRLRRTKPRPRVRYVITTDLPLSAEYADAMSSAWERWRKTGGDRPLLLSQCDVKEIRA